MGEVSSPLPLILDLIDSVEKIGSFAGVQKPGDLVRFFSVKWFNIDFGPPIPELFRFRQESRST
jgi:hypothetical protein